jgi:hypothetical protein
MKAKHFAIIVFLAVRPALADAHDHAQAVAGNAQTPAAAPAAAEAGAFPVPQPPAPSDSVGEFVERTVVVARQQAEDEVHYETRRQVNQLFGRLLRR